MRLHRSPSTPNEVNMSRSFQTIRSANSLWLRTESFTRSLLTASQSWPSFTVPVVEGGYSAQPYNRRLNLSVLHVTRLAYASRAPFWLAG